MWNIVYQCIALGYLVCVTCQIPYDGRGTYLSDDSYEPHESSHSFPTPQRMQTVNNYGTSSEDFPRFGSDNPSRSYYSGQFGYSGQPTHPHQSNYPGQAEHLPDTDYRRSYSPDLEPTTHQSRVVHCWLDGHMRIIKKTGYGDGNGRYELVLSTIFLNYFDSGSPITGNAEVRKKTLGNFVDGTRTLKGHGLDTLDIGVPMHPSTLRVWKTDVLSPIYNFVKTTGIPCEVSVSILYDTINDIRPTGFYVTAIEASMQAEDMDSVTYVLKGYLPNPPTELDMNVTVHATLSSAVCIKVEDPLAGASCVTPANQIDRTANYKDGRSFGRYELLYLIDYVRWTKEMDQSSPYPILNAFNALKYDDSHRELRGTKRPANNFLNNNDFVKAWKSQVAVPLSECFICTARRMGARLDVSLLPTYSGTSVNPSGFFIGVYGRPESGALIFQTYVTYNSSFPDNVEFVPSQESNTERQSNHTEFMSNGTENTHVVRSIEVNQVALVRMDVSGITRYELLSGIVSMENTVQEDLESPNSRKGEKFAKDLGDSDDIAGVLFGGLNNVSVIVPMHPLTLEVWKTKVENQIYDFVNSTGKQCEFTVTILYETKNDTRPNGFYVLAKPWMLGESEKRNKSSRTTSPFQYVLKGYVPNPSIKLNKNMAIQEVLSSPSGIEVVSRRNEKFCLTPIEQNDGTEARIEYVARFESFAVQKLIDQRSMMSETQDQQLSIPTTLEPFTDLESVYDRELMVNRELSKMKRPVNLIPNHEDFVEIWKTHVDTPFWKSFGETRLNRTILKGATITLYPTYNGTSVTPSGFFVTGHRSETPFDILMNTYIPLPVTPPSRLATVTTEKLPDESLTSCLLPPKLEGSSYRIGDCQPNQKDGFCEKPPGSWVVQYTQIIYECEEGYAHPRSSSIEWTEAYCLDGEWEPPRIQCQKKCAPLISASHDIECKYYGKSASCTDKVSPGTIARPNCKPHFHASDSADVYSENGCMEDGNWEYDLFECIPDCGVSNTIDRFRIARGDAVAPGEYPWSAGLFRKKNDTFEHFCGGSIINSNLILTAAHCIYDDVSGRDHNPSDIIVAVGKFNISWDILDAYEDRMTVLEVSRPTSYGRSGMHKSYFDDIAVLQLTESLRLSEFRLPVCIDWKKKGWFRNGTLGTVVGWGQEEHHQPSDLLQRAILPYVDNNTCSGMSPRFFQEHMLLDKFCVGSGDDFGISVQQGDSGGGFTFIRHKFHFLYGVHSLHPAYDNRFALYTNVTQKLDWLRKWAKTWPAPKPS